MATTTLGADAIFTLDSAALTDFIDTVTFTHNADALDVTTFGNDGHRFVGGLTNGTIAIGGVYDTSGTGPHDDITALIGTVVTFDWRPEGTGSSLPTVTGNVLVREYVESSAVADVVRWTASLQIDGDVTYGNQGA